jgi:Glycosyltransferase family 87
MRRIGWLPLICCAAISVLWGLSLGRSVPGGVIGFQGVYYGTRCLLHHCDPYNETELVQHYQVEGRQLPSDSIQRRKAVTLYVNLPTTFLFIAPFALLPWGPAHTLWIFLLIGGVILAAYLIWRFAVGYAPGVSSALVCILLLNCEVLFATGNTAGIVVGLTVIAVWCFLTERYTHAGVLCFAAALAIKPHDAGLLWFYFLLAGGAHRKRALQSLGITAALLFAAILWVSLAAPHWPSEMRSNLSAISLPGGLNEPGLNSMTGRTPAMVIDLQAIASAIWTAPGTYNAVSYLVCGTLLLIWTIATLRSRFSASNAWFAIASVSALTMLVTYHRPYDAKLLLLTIPACAILWAEGGLRGWLALILSTTGILMTGDIFLAFVSRFSKNIDISHANPARKLLVGMFSQPAPLALLAIAVFYLWVYLRATGEQKAA